MHALLVLKKLANCVIGMCNRDVDKGFICMDEKCTELFKRLTHSHPEVFGRGA